MTLYTRICDSLGTMPLSLYYVHPRPAEDEPGGWQVEVAADGQSVAASLTAAGFTVQECVDGPSRRWSINVRRSLLPIPKPTVATRAVSPAD